MKIIKSILLVAFISSLSIAQCKQLLKTSVSWDGGSIAYPKGEPEVTAIKLEFKKGEVLDFHCHLVPTFVYLLKGVVEIETTSGNKAIFKAGDSMLEVMKTLHKGTAKSNQIEVLVFFAGSKSTPNTVPSGSNEAKKHCT